MATISYDFCDLPVMHCAFYAHGSAKISYSSLYSGFVIRDIDLLPHDAKTSPGKHIGTDHKLHADLVAALEEHDIEAIEQHIKDDMRERRRAA